MTEGGTDRYGDDLSGLPPLVAAAVRLARRTRFGQSCLPEQGRLLAALAAGRAGGRIGETGTGCGVGLAWLASAVPPGTRLVSVERDAERAAAARDLFVTVPDVTVLTGDWTMLASYGPFDLLVLDGGGKRPADGPMADPARLLVPGGTLVLDDFAPATAWPPMHDGRPDETRLHWLAHPQLLATEVRVTAGMATIVATRTHATDP
ncbi:MAG: class I SAM-dependent methyltransferase [Frankiaceae bacterium]